MAYFIGGNLEKVILSRVKKILPRIPGHIRIKLLSWAEAVEMDGIIEVRRLPGFHDESLKGKRLGQRSIRLSRGYRAIYTEKNDGILHLIVVEEISKREY